MNISWRHLMAEPRHKLNRLALQWPRSKHWAAVGSEMTQMLALSQKERKLECFFLI
ncbi:hypothetical protein PS838_03188 [Pseudomonas fluorescens]|nr:hypothetical protein PS838_03188 [Pseudomonas fluorescens]